MSEPRRSTISAAEPQWSAAEQWLSAGVSGKGIHAALCHEHGYRSNTSSVARMSAALSTAQPSEVTVRLAFESGDAA